MINALIKAGVVRSTEQTQKTRKIGWYILLAVVVIAALLTVYLRGTLMGPSLIEITGDVSNPYSFPSKEFDLEKVTRQMDYKGVTTEYSGYPVKDIIAYAEPSALADTLLIQASDGYAFLIGYDELETNDNILIVQNGSGKNASIDIVGPESSKAWVRNVTLLSVITSESLTILDPTGETQAFDPDTWISEMDSTQVGLPDGYQKLQGVSVWKVIQSLPNAASPTEIVFKNTDEEISLPWSDLNENDNIRIFTVIGMDSITYALAEMSGDVLLYPFTEIEIH